MTAGGGGGGGGGVPRPPRPASAAPAAGISADGAGVDAGAESGAATAAGVLGGGAAAGGGAGAGAGGGGVLGAGAGDAPFIGELAHAGTPSAAVASSTLNNPPNNRADGRGRDDSDVMTVDSPASRACDRSRSIDRRRRRTRT